MMISCTYWEQFSYDFFYSTIFCCCFRPVRATVKELLQLDKPWQPDLTVSQPAPLFTYPVVNGQGLPAPDANLLLSTSGPLPFPTYFPALYALLCRHIDLQTQLDLLPFHDMAAAERREYLRQLNKEQVKQTIMCWFVLNKHLHSDGLVQERHNSNALAMELHLYGTNPLIYSGVPLKHNQFSKKYSQKTPYSLPVRAMYGVCFVEPAFD